MSDQSRGAANDDQLFKNTDEQERIYAPQQVPGATLPGEERDVGGTASQGAAQARGNDDERIVGADGDSGTVPIVGVRGDLSAAAPMPLPAATRDADLGDTQS